MPTDPEKPLSYRITVLGYGLIAYFAFLITILYYLGFLTNVGVPSGIDEGPTTPVTQAVAINIALVTLFAVQHSVMARSWFKDRLTRLMPDAIERSTYVLSSAVTLLIVAWFWRPLPGVLWDIGGFAGWILWGVFGFGVVIAVLSTFQISHTSLFGLQQVYDCYRERDSAAPSFQTPGFYRYVRHPMMTGLLVWFWGTPHMTVGHFLFAGGFTIYIFLGTQIEERMLIDVHGDSYREYRQVVPRFFPRPGRTANSMSSRNTQE